MLAAGNPGGEQGWGAGGGKSKSTFSLQSAKSIFNLIQKRVSPRDPNCDLKFKSTLPYGKAGGSPDHVTAQQGAGGGTAGWQPHRPAPNLSPS